MDIEKERILKLIFPEGVPEDLKENPELSSYLQKLGTYKVEQLKKEESRLQDEKHSIIEQTQELAITNYKTFIQAAECSRTVYKEFQNIESRAENLIEKLPKFDEKCQEFLNVANKINSDRRLNSITLKRNGQLLEILELPQLMEKCIRQGKYEEALELASYVQKMGEKHGDIPVINGIVASIESSWHTMLVQLVSQLRTDLQLPKCLQVVGYLRRMQAFGNCELKLKFLQARDRWLTELLDSIPKDDVQQHLTKTIELTRINLFNIITQYKAIFSEEDSTRTSINLKSDLVSSDGGRLFHSWLHTKIENFLRTLEYDLERGVSSIDTILGQCMYFGLSFSRVGADFRALMAPIFIRVIKRNFENQIIYANEQFKDEISKYTLINRTTTGLNRRKSDLSSSSSSSTIGGQDSLSPPETLLDFHPLATLCNNYLIAFNELRLCAPVAISDDITKILQKSLEVISKNILSFYRQEQQAFTGNENEIFIKLCSCYAYDFIPFIQRCIHAIFPQNILTIQLGVNLTMLQNESITFLKQKIILEPLKNLLPDKVDAILMQSQHHQTQSNETNNNKNQEIVNVN